MSDKSKNKANVGQADPGYAVHPFAIDEQPEVAPAPSLKCSLHNRMNYPQTISTGNAENEVIIVPPNGIVKNVDRSSIQANQLPTGIVVA